MMKAIIFDFDGTLADSGQCGLLATQQAFKDMGLAIPSKETIDYYMGIPIEQSFHEMSNHSLSEEQFSLLLQRFRQAYKQLEEKTLTAFPQIDEILRKLQQQGFSLFVLSSKKTDVLYRNLQKLQLDAYFKDWYGSDKVDHYKPHPDGIYKIAECYLLDMSNCIMIGDATFDIQMGKAAGCQTVAVNWGSHSKEQLLNEQPTYFAHEVNDLYDILSSEIM